jgi:phenylalanyl-tRNA synthetase alpha subunit
VEKILQKLKMAKTELKDIQKQCQKQWDESLHKHLQEEETKAQELEEADVAAKTVRKIKNIICSEHQFMSYTNKICQVFKGFNSRGS